MTDLMLLPSWVPAALTFLSVTLIAFMAAAYFFDRSKVRGRYAATALAGARGGYAAPQLPAARPRQITPERLGLDAEAQKKLRADLVRAGYFGPNAPVTYTVIRTLLVVIIPLVAYLLVSQRFGHWGWTSKFAVIAGAFLVAYYMGRVYLTRRIRRLQGRYRLFFPDFLDMLTVCVNGGLSLEAALERVAQELGSAEREFRTNLQLMMAEMRAGKTTIESLKGFAGRLGLAEATSLATLLQQSLELGTDVSAALSTYSDEMREKRMSRAEEKAFALPVKMTIPLVLFILPTIFLAIMTPAVIKLLTVLGN